jgi:hypothetical protein
VTRWSPGEALVERLLEQGRVERVQGAPADGDAWLERARRGLDAARIVGGGTRQQRRSLLRRRPLLLPNLGFF